MVRLFDPLDPRLTLSTRVDESLDVDAGDPNIVTAARAAEGIAPT
jgi:hypothetical protein